MRAGTGGGVVAVFGVEFEGEGAVGLEEELVEMLVCDFDEAVEEGRDVEGGGVVVDGSDFGSEVPVVVLSKGRGEESIWVE